ncbi:MAG: M23 family metallopeptidase [Waterburya sp.]
MVRTTLIGLLVAGVTPIALAEPSVLNNKQSAILAPQLLPDTIGLSTFCSLSNLSTVCSNSSFFNQSKILHPSGSTVCLCRLNRPPQLSHRATTEPAWTSSEVNSAFGLQTVTKILLSNSKFSGCLEQLSPSQLSSQEILKLPSNEKKARLEIPTAQTTLKPTVNLNLFPNFDLISSSRVTAAPQECVSSWQQKLNQKTVATSKLVFSDNNISKPSSSSSAVAPLTQFPKLSRSSLIIPFPKEDSSFIPNSTKLANPAPETQRIGSTFGWRIRPYSNQLQFHDGIDYGAPLGSPVVAVDDGIVTRVISGCIDFNDLYCGGQLGNWVEIDHGDGAIATYGHLKNSSITVKEGMKVLKNQEIAQIGSSGWSTGAHLHFRIQVNGKEEDPAKFVVSPNDLET